MNNKVTFVATALGVAALLTGCTLNVTVPGSGPGSEPTINPPATTAATPPPVSPPFQDLNGCPAGFADAFNTAASSTIENDGFFTKEQSANEFFFGVPVNHTGSFFQYMENGQSEEGNPNAVGFIPGDYSVLRNIDSSLVAGGYTLTTENESNQCSALVSPDGKYKFTFHVNSDSSYNQPQVIKDAIATAINLPFVSVRSIATWVQRDYPLVGTCP